MISSNAKTNPSVLSQVQGVRAPVTPTMAPTTREPEINTAKCCENHTAVAEEAYKTYERNGSKHGDDVQDWMAAEAQVKARSKS